MIDRESIISIHLFKSNSKQYCSTSYINIFRFLLTSLSPSTIAMSYFAAPSRLCLLLLSFLALSVGFEPARAEEKIAVSFELPPATVAPLPPMRYPDTLPPITSPQKDIATERNATTERDTTTKKDSTEKDITEEETPTAKKSAEAIEPFRKEDIALQFAHDDVAMPVASQIQKEKVSTVPKALAVNSATDKLLAASSERSPTLIGSSGMVRSLQQRLDQSSGEHSTSTANILQADILEDWIYEGGSNSLVARTVGSAEGTRKSNGERTKAYYGHVDPGNGAWNLGTFSYQHEASSPEEADEKQLMRLQRQEYQLKEKAAQWKVPLSIEVRLNGLDLANQAPLAALDKGGYIERLAEAYASGKSGEAAIVWARTQAYFDTDKQVWDAPGLGNNRYSIQQDQERRMAAINSALRRYQDEHVGTVGSLLKVGVASTSATVENPLLAGPNLNNSSNLTDTDSLNSVEFSLKTASPAVSQYVSESVAASVAAVDNSEAIVEDSNLAIESDLTDLSQVGLGEWNDDYERAASETMDLIEAKSVPLSVPLDDGLAFADDQITNLTVADDYAIAPQLSDANLAKPDPKLAPIASVLEQPETGSLLEEAQLENQEVQDMDLLDQAVQDQDVQNKNLQEQDLLEAKLDRLLTGIEAGDRTHPF